MTTAITGTHPVEPSRLRNRRGSRRGDPALRRIVATMTAATRAMVLEMDPRGLVVHTRDAMPLPERLALAFALLRHWRRRGDTLTPARFRDLADRAFREVPEAMAEAMLRWPCEPFHLRPDPLRRGGLVHALTPPVDEAVRYRVTDVHLLGWRAHEPREGTYLGWLVPWGDQPVLLALHRPHGPRLRALRTYLEARARIEAEDPTSGTQPPFALGDLLEILSAGEGIP